MRYHDLFDRPLSPRGRKFCDPLWAGANAYAPIDLSCGFLGRPDHFV